MIKKQTTSLPSNVTVATNYYAQKTLNIQLQEGKESMNLKE